MTKKIHNEQDKFNTMCTISKTTLILDIWQEHSPLHPAGLFPFLYTSLGRCPWEADLCALHPWVSLLSGFQLGSATAEYREAGV